MTYCGITALCVASRGKNEVRKDKTKQYGSARLWKHCGTDAASLPLSVPSWHKVLLTARLVREPAFDGWTDVWIARSFCHGNCPLEGVAAMMSRDRN